MTDIAMAGVGALPSATEGTTGQGGPELTPVDQGDSAFFEQALQPVDSGQTSDGVALTQPQGPSAAENLLERMHAFSERAAERGEALEDMVLRATKTLSPVDMVQANRMMSDYYLENMMTAKMIGQATDAVERLTNLQ